MGWWKCEHGIIGDEPADAMDACLRKIEAIYRRRAGRIPT